MELWFIYSLIGAFCAGFISFGFKIAAERGYDGRIIVGLNFFLLGLISLFVWVFQGADTSGFQIAAVTGIIFGALTALSNALKVFSLKYMDAAIFFPIYKTLGPLVVAVIGVLAFSESLSTYELLGIAAGILVPLLLIHKSEHARQNNLFYGLLIMVASVTLAVLAIVAQKIAADQLPDVWLFLAISGFAGFGGAFISYLAKNSITTIQLRDPAIKKAFQLGLGLGVLEFVSSYTFIKALEDGLLGVVYTIFSFYILIPIVLAVWWYKEHINARKVIAISLSVLALIFFEL